MEINNVNIKHIKAINKKDLNATRGEILPARSVMEMARIELREMQQQALDETLESMSLAFGSRLRDDQRGGEGVRQQRDQQLLLKMIAQIQKNGGDVNLLAQAPSMGQEMQFIQAQQILQTSALIAQNNNSPARRHELSKKLAELLEEEGWEIELFGLLEFGNCLPEGLGPIKRLFQQSIKEEEHSLEAWFEKVRRWPDRRNKIKVLLNALAFDLVTQPPPVRGRRLAASLYQLRRLILFLGLEDHCAHVGVVCGISGESVLCEILAIIGQSWLFHDWLERRLTDTLALSVEKIVIFTRRLTELFKLLPDSCFSDTDQREQIIEVLSNF